MRIVVTGTSSGIGLELARYLCRSGHTVWGIARSAQEASAVHSSLFTSVRADVSRYQDVAAAAGAIGGSHAGIDALITAAGIQGEIGRTLSSKPDGWAKTIRINLDGTYHCIRAFAALLDNHENPRAKIIAFSGGGATKARSNFSAYGASKTAVVRLIETIAEEEAGHALDINAVAPGAINTRLTDEVLSLGAAIVGEAEYAAAAKQKATGGGDITKVLGLVDWLISEESDGVSGRLISAPWDSWSNLGKHIASLKGSDVYQLRRILPAERGMNWT